MATGTTAKMHRTAITWKGSWLSVDGLRLGPFAPLVLRVRAGGIELTLLPSELEGLAPWLIALAQGDATPGHGDPRGFVWWPAEPVNYGWSAAAHESYEGWLSVWRRSPEYQRRYPIRGVG